MLGASEIQVLIVEKELNSASDIRDWAFRNPVLPVFVSSGLDALIWLGKGNIPDLIMVDSGIEPMDGPDFIKTIKASGFFQDIPVLAFGYPENHPMLANMRQAGAGEHIFLPIKADFINERLKGFLALSEKFQDIF